MVFSKKHAKRAAIVAIGIFVIFFIVTGVIAFTNQTDYRQFKIFSTINEFDNIIESNNFEKLTADKDKHIKSLAYVEQAEYKIKVDKKTYKIYAYVFSDDNGAREYFKNVTGKKSDTESSFSGSSNIYFRSRLVVYKNNRVYKIEGQNTWKFNKFIEILNKELTEPIKN